MPSCPKCKSTKVKVVQEEGLDFIRCPQCGYDELETDSVFPQQRTTQREKGRYSPFKTGGHRRTE